MRRVRAARRHGPALDRPLPVVCDAQPDGGRGRVPVCPRELGSRGKACDLRCDRGRRVAALLLPALDAERGAAGDQEVRRRPDVVRVQRCIGQSELLRHQDRVRRLVELCAERVRRNLAVHEAVPRHRTIGKLLPLEEEERRVTRGREVAGGDQARPALVEVAREHLAVGAEVGVRGVAGRDRLTPRRGEAGDDRAGERLVLRRLDHVGAQVIRVLELLPVRGFDPGQALHSRLEQRVVVLLPTLLVVLERRGEAEAERPFGGADRLFLGRAEAEREYGLSAVVQDDTSGLDDVAAESVGVGVCQRVGGVELDEPVARSAHEAARRLAERAVQRREDRLRVVTVRGVRRGDRIRRDEDGMAGRVVHRRGVGPAVPRAAAAVPVDRRIEPDVEPVARIARLELDAHQHRAPLRDR